MRKPYYGSLVHVGVLGCLEVFFVLCGCIARQGNTDAYRAYDEFLHGFWGNQLNCGKLMPFLEGKASILFHCQRAGPVVRQANEAESVTLTEGAIVKKLLFDLPGANAASAAPTLPLVVA
jgi:hypothetical protein